MLLGLLVTLYVVASCPRWDLGEALGQRRLVDWSAPIAIGFATVFARARLPQRRRLTRALVVAGLGECAVTALYAWRRAYRRRPSHVPARRRRRGRGA